MTETSSDGRRRPRRTGPRARTLSLKVMAAAQRAERRQGLTPAYPRELEDPRPITRGDCEGGERPCPYVACQHHLYLEVNPETGSVKLNFPNLEPWELLHTCALDVADDGRQTLEQIGAVLNITRERVRQVGMRALVRLAPELRAVTGLTGEEMLQALDDGLAPGEGEGVG